jgi:uncharacterized protein (TIGR02569 family)
MLSEEVLHSFNLNGKIIPLSGGQNTSVRVNNAVLKPVEDVTESYEWLLMVINNIKPKGYRLSKPIKSSKGTFVSSGWVCTKFERGEEVKGRIKEKLQVSRLFHYDLSNIKIRDDFSQTANPWVMAHRIAWQKDELPKEIHTKIRKILNELLQKLRLKEHYNLQLVHADLSGNILFDDVLDPLIIDFSPTIAPVEYAEAILVCDCIAWQGSMISEIELLPKHTDIKEMIMRAVIFRLAVEAIFSKNKLDQFINQFNLFKPIIDYVD